MRWAARAVLLAAAAACGAVGRPAFKVSLTQKGYAQFLQYELDTPPLAEFTFCAWLRFFHLDRAQSILTYVAGGERAVRLRLEAGGRRAALALGGAGRWRVPLRVAAREWRHVCLSYGARRGAWAFYVDARLASCAASRALHGRVLPAGGSIIVGYDVANDGVQNGLEGEIFGVNMLLSSTIERNYTIKSHAHFKQRTFNRNKLVDNNDNKYIVLGDLKSGKNQNSQPDDSSALSNSSTNYIKIKTPYSFIEHDVGQLRGRNLIEAKSADKSNEKEILDFPATHSMRTTKNHKINFWNIINEAENVEKLKNAEIYSGTQSIPKVSEYETPPPPDPVHDYFNKKIFYKSPVAYYHDKVKNLDDINKNKVKLTRVTDIETPPPPNKNSKVYGQWTSSNFANSVLNYLKNINFNQREQKGVPPTIPLLKMSDSFPYASDIKVSKILPNYNFQRRNFVDKRLIVKKRDAKYPEINVQVLQDNLRDQIIQSHAQTRPNNVEVTSRGQELKKKEHRFYRNVKDLQSSEETDSVEMQKSIAGLHLKKNSFNSNKMITILPFLKTLEYYAENRQENKKEQINTNDMYSNSLSNKNKWHNVKSFNNDYTPRQIDWNLQGDIQDKITEVNKKHPSIRLKFKPESHKLETVEDSNIIQGRNLAAEVSNTSKHNVDSVSLFKYKHGLLHNRNTKIASSETVDDFEKERTDTNNDHDATDFNRRVKLGNALNERNVIGHDTDSSKGSFVGGDEATPDIDRHRAAADGDGGVVPPSLGPRVCKDVEVGDRPLYVQADGSIDVTHILSPIRERNVGIEFIIQNYRKCSLENTAWKDNPLLFIDWNETPVRLFGGARPIETTDLCGFF